MKVNNSELVKVDVLLELKAAADRKWRGDPACQQAGLFWRAAEELEQKEIEINGLKELLVLAAVPLEALFISGTKKIHSAELEMSIDQAVIKIRSYFAKAERLRRKREDPELLRELRELREENKRLRGAISEYANIHNWNKDSKGVFRVWLEPKVAEPATYSGFEMAKAALSGGGYRRFLDDFLDR